jgi:hypothetical protein
MYIVVTLVEIVSLEREGFHFMKKFHPTLVISMLICLGILTSIPMSASAASTPAAASAKHSITAPVTGSASNGDVFTGTFTVTHFVTKHNTLFATGTIKGTVKKASGAQVAQVVNQQVSVPAALPVASAVGTCSVLALTLGPLDLNLLGLVVHLNQVVLNITALPAGGLLGQLLCDVANLLNGGIPLSGLTGLLNQILGAL